MEGGCSCGEVRYRLESAPLYIHCCHCSWCQRETGSAFVLNALIESDRVTVLEGRPNRVDTPSESGKGQKIWRCPTCQVALWSHYAGGGDKLAFVRVGALDDPEGFTPDIHIFTASKQPWVVIPDDHLSVEEYYSAKDVWPAASQDRWRALMQRSGDAEESEGPG